jgi:hypothetical protein
MVYSLAAEATLGVASAAISAKAGRNFFMQTYSSGGLDSTS